MWGDYMPLMVVAESTDSESVILKWNNNYGIVEQGMKPSEIQWGHSELLDTKGFNPVDPPKPFKPKVNKSMKIDTQRVLYVDLFKSLFHHLNFGHLVKRAVQVHGKNGIFTRMQWVDPNDASTGHGVRKISNKREYTQAKKDGVFDHPLAHKALEDQGINFDKHNFKEHPHFYVPETEESSTRKRKNTVPHGNDTEFSRAFKDADFRKQEQEQLKVNSGEFKKRKDTPKSNNILDTFPSKTSVNRTKIPQSGKDTTDKVREVMEKYGADPSTVEYFREVENINWRKYDHDDYSGKLRELCEITKKHWHNVIKPAVKKFVEEGEPTNSTVKKIQTQCLESIDYKTGNYDEPILSSIVAHPSILKHAIDTALGPIKASKIRSDLKNCNLTHNTYKQCIEEIQSTGYRASTPQSYALGKGGGNEKDIKVIDSILSRTDLSGKEKLDELTEVTRVVGLSKGAFDYHEVYSPLTEKLWMDLDKRFKSEFNMGINPDDPKPAYIALNPNGGEEGGFRCCNDGTVFEVSPDILKDCTANLYDSYEKAEQIPRVQDMNHLKDAYIVRNLYDWGYGDPFENPDWVDSHRDDWELELQYHHPVVDPKYLSLVKEGVEQPPPPKVRNKWGDEDNWEDDPTSFTVFKSDKSICNTPVFYINLYKSFHQLNFSHLVKKAVQVRGKNGKIFTRMQWVNPGSASTGHGVRKISNNKEHLQAIKDGVYKHPMAKKALEDQGINWDEHNFGEHPHFYVPETEESNAKNRRNRLPHSRDTEFSEAFKKLNFKQREPKPSKNIPPKTKKVMDQYGAHESLGDYFHEMESQDWASRKNDRQRFHLAQSIVDKHWKSSIQPLVSKSIDDSDVDPFTKEMQQQCLDCLDWEIPTRGLRKISSSSKIMAHPAILRHALDKIVGDAKANRLRNSIKNGILTFNTHVEKIEEIQTRGYSPSQPATYLEKMGTKEDCETFEWIASWNKPDFEKLEEIRKIATSIDLSEGTPGYDEDYSNNGQLTGEAWSDLYLRLCSEKNIGIPIGSPKPAYFALNPDADPGGAAHIFGDGTVFEIDPAILKHSTANIGDSYYVARPVPQVHSMEHLNDAYILRRIDDAKSYLYDDDHTDIFSNSDWTNSRKSYSSDYPAEVLYHRTLVDPKFLKLVRKGEKIEDEEEDDF